MKSRGFLKLNVIGCILAISVSSLAKQTVGDLLSQAQQSSRGAGATNVALKKSSINLPESQLSFSQSQSHVNLDSVKPPKSSELMRPSGDSNRDQYESVLDQQIQELYKLTQKFKNSPNRGELWLRLAELYVEKSTLLDAKIQDAYDSKLRAYKEGKTKVKPALDQKDAREYNKKAIRLYEWFEKDFPRDSKMSQALFFLGYNYFELGDTKKGAYFYDRLNREYPSSPFVGESHFALGEFYFENERWSTAYKEYSFLIKAKKHKLHSFAMYKGAWCLYRAGQHKQALNYIEYLIRYSRDNPNSATDNKTRLESEALRDIVVFYAAEGNPKNAYSYFKELLGADDVSPYVEKLAYYYADKGDKESSRILFKSLIADKPNAAKAFEYQYQIVQNLFYSKNSPQFKEELYRWIKDYGQNSSWYSANQSQKEFIDNSVKLREQTLRNWILQQHQSAQNSRAPYSQKQASEGYGLYISEFASHPMAADMHFYYGELLYDMGKFDEASQQYRWVVDFGPQAKFYNQSGMNLILAAEKSVPSDKELQQKVGNSVDSIPLDPRVERFIKAALWHLDKFPNAEKNPEIKFRVGRLYYLHNQFDEANKYFKDIVKNHQNTKYSEYSANLMLDIYNLKKDYVGLEKTGAELLASPSFASTKAGQEIRNVLEKASFKKAQDLEVDKKYGDSAITFESFARQNPKSNLAVTAWFNAGVNYERDSKNLSAIQAYNQVLVSKYDEAKTLKPKAKRLLAKLYQNSAQFEEAAKLFTESAHESPQDPLAGNFIFNAGIMYEALGRLDDAAKSYNEYYKSSKKNSEKQEALLAMAEIYRKSNNRSAAIEKYKEYISLNPADPQKLIEAHYWVYNFLEKAHHSEAETWKAKTLTIQRRLSANHKGVGNKYAAKIKIGDAELALEKYKAIKIPADPAKQKKAVDQKVDSLSALNKQLNEIVKYESAEEIVTSLAISGEANYHMAQSILKSPSPPGLNAQEEKQYRDGIAKFAEPFLEKTRESYKSAVEKGYEFEVYNEAYRIAREYMAQIDKNYYDKGELNFDTRFINWMQ